MAKSDETARVLIALTESSPVDDLWQAAIRLMDHTNADLMTLFLAENHWHAVMKWAGLFVGCSGDDRAGRQRFVGPSMRSNRRLRTRPPCRRKPSTAPSASRRNSV